jgi:hypothetical protein
VGTWETGGFGDLISGMESLLRGRILEMNDGLGGMREDLLVVSMSGFWALAKGKWWPRRLVSRAETTNMVVVAGVHRQGSK